MPHAIAAAPKNFLPNSARTLETGAANRTALRKFGPPKKVASIRRKFEGRALLAQIPGPALRAVAESAQPKRTL
jgi:hypothetical protein